MYPYKYTYPTNTDVNTIGYSGAMVNNMGNGMYQSAIEDATDKREIVKASIQRILSTDAGERVMNPTFGSRLRKMLFEPIDNFTITDIKEEMTRLINAQEPRIYVSQLTVTPDVENHTIYVNMGITFKDDGISDAMEFAIA